MLAGSKPVAIPGLNSGNIILLLGCWQSAAFDFSFAQLKYVEGLHEVYHFLSH